MNAPIILSHSEREEMTSISSNISDEELMSRYIFSQQDIENIQSHRMVQNRIGFAVQLCYLRHPGWSLTQTCCPPKKLLDFVCVQIGERKHSEKWFRDKYLSNKKTISSHLKEISKLYGYRKFCPADEKKVKAIINDNAEVIDDRYSMISNAVEYFCERRIFPPGISTIERWVLSACFEKEEEIVNKLSQQLSEYTRKLLDQMLDYKDNEEGVYTMKQLEDISGRANPIAFTDIANKIKFIESVLEGVDMSFINPNMLQVLSREINLRRKFSLKRSDREKIYAKLCCWLCVKHASLIDKAITISRSIMKNIKKKTDKTLQKRFSENRKKYHEFLKYFRGLSKSLLKAKDNDITLSFCFESYTSYNQLEEVYNKMLEIEEPDDEFIDAITNFFPTVRQFSPALYDSLRFVSSNEECIPVINAVSTLKNMEKNGNTEIPVNAPTNHIKGIWLSHLKTKEGKTNRAVYEMCTLMTLTEMIKSDSIDVVGSETYINLNNRILSESEWAKVTDKSDVLAVPLDFNDYMSDSACRMNNAYSFCSDSLENKEDIWIEKGHMHLSPLPKEVPEEAQALAELCYSLMPKVSIAEVLLEVAKWTGYDKCLNNSLLKNTSVQLEDRELILATLMAVGTNVGYARMAQATMKYSADTMAGACKNRLSHDAIRAAQAEIIQYQSKQSMASVWGSGRTSSSDGMRVRSYVFALNAEHNPHYGFEKGCTMYRFISDKYYSFEVKVINTNAGEAPHVIDGVLSHESITTESISEHYTDTGGSSFHVSALSHILGFMFAPRIKNIHQALLFCHTDMEERENMSEVKFCKITSYTLDILRTQWDNMLRIAYSVKKGLIPASLVLSKISSANNMIGHAFRIMGQIERTIFLLQYYADSVLRKRIQIGLNKGERLNQLARVVFFGKEGGFRVRNPEAQLQRASALNIILNAIITWNTVYLQRCINELKRNKIHFNSKHLKHISPLNWQHILFLGTY